MKYIMFSFIVFCGVSCNQKVDKSFPSVEILAHSHGQEWFRLHISEVKKDKVIGLWSGDGTTRHHGGGMSVTEAGTFPVMIQQIDEQTIKWFIHFDEANYGTALYRLSKPIPMGVRSHFSGEQIALDQIILSTGKLSSSLDETTEDLIYIGFGYEE